MTHAELIELFSAYHAETWPDRRLWANRTGVAVYGKQAVPYGIPPPLLGRKQKDGGGGADLFSFGNEDGYFTVWFFEAKTIGDKMKSNQRRVANHLIAQGAKYWIVQEIPGGGFDLVRYQL